MISTNFAILVCYLLLATMTDVSRGQRNERIESYKPPAQIKRHVSRPVYGPEGFVPYKFEYVVQNEPYGLNYGHQQAGDASGEVTGRYFVAQPDGRLRTVDFTANDNQGFVADVNYEGEAVYDPRPAPVVVHSYAKPVQHAQPTPPPTPSYGSLKVQALPEKKLAYGAPVFVDNHRRPVSYSG